MKLILLRDVKKVGRTGQVVEASEGYARNFLIPNKLALPATAQTIEAKQLESKRGAQKAASEAADRVRLIERVSAKTYHFTAPGDKNGHLYASLKKSEILAKISEGEASLERVMRLENYTPIKTAGEHTLSINLAGTGSKSIKIIVKAQS